MNLPSDHINTGVNCVKKKCCGNIWRMQELTSKKDESMELSTEQFRIYAAFDILCFTLPFHRSVLSIIKEKLKTYKVSLEIPKLGF